MSDEFQSMVNESKKYFAYHRYHKEDINKCYEEIRVKWKIDSIDELLNFSTGELANKLTDYPYKNESMCVPAMILNLANHYQKDSKRWEEYKDKYELCWGCDRSSYDLGEVGLGDFYSFKGNMYCRHCYDDIVKNEDPN